jgi:hypothetical protein
MIRPDHESDVRAQWPSCAGWEGPSDEVVDGFNTEGRALTHRLQAALGPDATVVYESI